MDKTKIYEYREDFMDVDLYHSHEGILKGWKFRIRKQTPGTRQASIVHIDRAKRLIKWMSERIQGVEEETIEQAWEKLIETARQFSEKYQVNINLEMNDENGELK